MITEVIKSKRDILGNPVLQIKYENKYQNSPMAKKRKLVGIKIFRGEYRVAILIMINRNLEPSLTSLILLFPVLNSVSIGT